MMPLKPKHAGIYYNAGQIQLAQEHRNSEPIAAATHFLAHTTGETPLASAQLAGLRYQFLGDDASGLHAVDLLQQAAPRAMAASTLEATRSLLGWLSVLESVRTHPAWADLQSPWFESLSKQLTSIPRPNDATLLEELWAGALDIGAAIVLEEESLFDRGAGIYRRAIEQYIHPEGYLKGMVDADDATATYHLQVSGTCALVLMAEMAEHAGVDLWSVNNRGVTPLTATTYLLYYYYYPEKWKWEDNLTAEMTNALMKTEGAFIEIINRRHPLRGGDILLDELRPLFGVYCGGLTTLTHGIPAPQKKKRWGLFG